MLKRPVRCGEHGLDVHRPVGHLRRGRYNLYLERRVGLQRAGYAAVRDGEEDGDRDRGRMAASAAARRWRPLLHVPAT